MNGMIRSDSTSDISYLFLPTNQDNSEDMTGECKGQERTKCPWYIGFYTDSPILKSLSTYSFDKRIDTLGSLLGKD